MAVVDILVRSLGRVTLAEIVLASVFTVAYVAVGWWAPTRAGRRGAADLARRRLRGHRPADEAAPPKRVQARARVHGRSHAARARAGRPAADHRPRRLRPAQQGLRHARRRRGPRGDRRAPPCAGADDGRRGRASAGTSSRCSTGVRSTPRPPSGSRPQWKRRSGVRSRPRSGRVRVGVSIGALPIRPAPSIPSAATLMDWADGTMQEQKRAQKEGRSQKGVKFDRYGASPSSDTRSDDHPTSWGPGCRAAARTCWSSARSSPRAPCLSRPRSYWGSGCCADERAGYRQIGVPPCSPTRRRPSANLAGSNGAMSTEVAAPSRISSAIPRPIAGAVLNPVPLWPQSR